MANNDKPYFPAQLLHTYDEAAALLSMGKTQVRQLVNDDELDAIPTGAGRGIRVTHESLLRYIERQRTKAAEVIQARRDKYRAARATNKTKKNGGQR